MGLREGMALGRGRNGHEKGEEKERRDGVEIGGGGWNEIGKGGR